jgi:putative membrane protein insertion efficiency factor
MIIIIRFWRRWISPLYSWTNCCRFTPSCSAYALQCYQRHRPIYATVLMFWRLFRCNPFCRGGYDPCP